MPGDSATQRNNVLKRFGPELDATPLLRFIEMRMHDWQDTRKNSNSWGTTYWDGLNVNDGDADALIGMSHRSLARLRSRGTIRFWQADKICTKLGVHPIDVFGYQAYTTAFEGLDEETKEGGEQLLVS